MSVWSKLMAIGKDGKSEKISQGFGLGIRQHNDVMLAYGYTRTVEREIILTDGQFMIVRLDVGAIEQHHAEFRKVGSEAGSLRIRLYDATDNTGLFPASPIAMPSVNQKGLVVETVGVDVVGEFNGYAASSSNPFSALTPIENDPLWTSAGGGPVDPDADQFPDVNGRYYFADKVYAVVIENIGGETTGVSYKYQWHEY